MKIAFITGSLAPGQDGVGDFVRTLAAGCVRRGHTVALVALAEPGSRATTAPEPWAIRRQTLAETRADPAGLRTWLENFSPDWASLHFVPYSYDPRGFFGDAVDFIAGAMKTAPRREIFFHETWIGMADDAPWRERIMGAWQRRATARLLQAISPTVVHTSIGYYRAALEAAFGRSAELVPMFGCVPLLGEPLPPAGAGVFGKDALVAGMFGTLHPNWEAEPFLSDFAALATAQGRRAVLASAGALRSGAGLFARLGEVWRERVEFVALGEKSVEDLAGFFSRCDFAVTSSPWNMIGKSSSAAALREHGLGVVVTNGGAQPRFKLAGADAEPGDDGFVPYFRERACLPQALRRSPPRSGADRAVDKFLRDLTA